jgi:hypothetical protein
MVARSRPQQCLEAMLARHSAEEMVLALGLARAPRIVRSAARAAFGFASVPLGRILARFDARIAQIGIADAAAAALDDLGVEWAREGTLPSSGPLLVVSNHPGAYDAFVLLAAIGRFDAAIVATDRSLLRALPTLARHLIFVREQDHVASRALGTRRALRHLAAGGALIHFGAGRIEVDPAFPGKDTPGLLASWLPGTGALVRGTARAHGVVAAAVIEGVHSKRAKQLLVTKLAERRGVTTLAPLLQIAVPAYRNVHARALFSKAVDGLSLAAGATDEQTTARVRSMALRLLGQPRRA